MAKKTPEEEAQNALTWGSKRSSLSPEAQVAYDRLLEQHKDLAENQARESYLATPVGRAETAHQEGRAFFQLTGPISEVEGRASDWILSQSTETRRFVHTDLLGQIEEVGWRLEHVGYVFVETGEVARSKVTSRGSVSRTQGYVEGIYLFRRVQ
jgi:hypothetical protein